MNFEEVKQYLDQNKENEEVRNYLQGAIGVEGVERFLKENNEGKSWFDSLVDKRSSKSLDTWKANNLEKLIDEEVKKRFPQKGEKEIEVEKLKAEVERMKLEKARETLANKAIKIAGEKKLPLNLVDFFIGENEETTAKNLKDLEDSFNAAVQKTVEARLKGDGYNPPKDSAGGTFTIDAIKSMSSEEINSNWDKVKDLLKKG